jgi:diadenosine tetraphosphate (Ap4A) HIT family hydrolase
MNDANCIFCRIVRGQAEASLVYEDDVVVAFLDSHPVAEGHTLVVPRRHAPDLASLDRESGAGLMAAARLIAMALRSGPEAAEGVNLHLADGPAAGQTVFHTHVHVIPRFGGDGFGFRIPFGSRPTPDRRSLEETAARLEQAVAAAGPS